MLTTTTSPGYKIYYVSYKQSLVSGIEATYDDVSDGPAWGCEGSFRVLGVCSSLIRMLFDGRGMRQVLTREEWWKWFDKHILWHDIVAEEGSSRRLDESDVTSAPFYQRAFALLRNANVVDSLD